MHLGGRGGGGGMSSSGGLCTRPAAALEDVGVDHGGAHVLVAEEFLHRTDVVAVFQEVGGEGMAEGMRCNPFGDGGCFRGLPDRSLQAALVHVMAADEAGVGSTDNRSEGKTYCQSQSRLAVGYLRSRASGR